jgi:hypothetical protein
MTDAVYSLSNSDDVQLLIQHEKTGVDNYEELIALRASRQGIQPFEDEYRPIELHADGASRKKSADLSITDLNLFLW